MRKTVRKNGAPLYFAYHFLIAGSLNRLPGITRGHLLQILPPQRERGDTITITSAILTGSCGEVGWIAEKTAPESGTVCPRSAPT